MASPLASDMELTQAGKTLPAWANPKTTGRDFTMLKLGRQEPNAIATIHLQSGIQAVFYSFPGIQR
jgi:hypothetical protein